MTATDVTSIDLAKVREELHRLVDQLPAWEAADAIDHVRYLLSDGEELTEEEMGGTSRGGGDGSRGVRHSRRDRGPARSVTHTVRTARRADSYLRRLDAATERLIAERLAEIGADPYARHSKLVVNTGGQRSSRVGEYRIVFTTNDVEQSIDVIGIGPRGRVYRNV